MDADLPDDAERYLIAAVVPCPFCVDGNVAALDEDAPVMCHKCDGRGTRTVVTDVEVERIPLRLLDAAAEPEPLWREVPRG